MRPLPLPPSLPQEGFAGDVIGLTNPGAFAIADTLVGLGGPVLAFPPIPTFSPELFAYIRCPPNQKKPFLKGVEGERLAVGSWRFAISSALVSLGGAWRWRGR